QATKILVWEAEAEAESWRFTYVGNQAKEILGYPITDWYEPDFLDLHLHSEDKHEIFCKKHADQYDLTFRMIANDRRVVWFHNLISVTSRYGQTRRMSGFMIDISERKRAEETSRDLSGRLIAAQEKERSRIARELHDDFNQRLALLSIELEQLGKQTAKDPASRQLFKKLQKQTQEISSDIHRLSHRLHPNKLDHLGLAAAVRSLCEEMSESAKLKVVFHQNGFPAALTKELDLCVFRVAQEALGNVVKHSGAQSVRVVLWKTNNVVRLSVSDDGCGFDPKSEKSQGGLGFISMKERVHILGGKMQISSQPRCGTRINVAVPLRLVTIIDKEPENRVNPTKQ
ncbi:MAG: histidine kinase, partial [Pyrinomonadaceae bacterium]|nr:histidine kinase [Pyrinomonadaceae bacterium]